MSDRIVRPIVLMCMFVWTVTVFAQHIVQGDTVRASVMLSTANALMDAGNFDSARTVLKDLEDYAATSRLPLWVAKAKQRTGFALWRTGENERGLALFQEALPVFAQFHDTSMMGKCELDIALSYKNLSNMSACLAHNTTALALYDAGRDTVGMAAVLQNMGTMYSDMGNYESAREQLQKAYVLLKRGGRPEIRKTLGLFSQLSERQGDLPTAIAYADSAIAMHKTAGDVRLAARALGFRSRAQLKMGRTKEALADAREAQALTTDPLYVLDAILSEGKALQAMGRVKEALPVYGRAERVAIQAGNMGMLGSIQLRTADILSGLGDHKAAYQKLKLYMHLQDSCRVESSTRDVTRTEMKMAFAKEQLADSLQRAHGLVIAERDHETTLSKERNRRNIALVAVGATVLLTLLLWSRLRYARRTRETILRTQRQLVESEKQHAAEQVRARIARDMHDEIGSELTKITLLASEGKRGHNGTGEHMDRVVNMSRHVSATLNDVVWSVDPQHDTVGSLVLHAQHFSERMLQGQPAHADLHFALKGPDRAIDPAVKRNIFLLLKEALNNALKYAQAQHIHVSLDADTTHFRLVIKDDGEGFNTAERALEGNGLRNMQARSRDLGAELHIITALGHGCAVVVSGPLD